MTYDKYSLTAELTPILLKGFRSGFGKDLIEDALFDALSIARVQYHHETRQAKQAEDKKEKVREMLIASTKAIRDIETDENLKTLLTDELIEKTCSDDLLLNIVTNLSDAVERVRGFLEEEKEQQQKKPPLKINLENCIKDEDDKKIADWLKNL